MARLEEAGYVIHLRYRAERGRWLTSSFAGSTPEVARSLADAWLAEHPDSNAKEKPSPYRRTGFQSSEDQASADQSSETQAFSTSKTDDNTDRNTDKQDHDAASAASRRVDADASTSCGADAPRDDDANPIDPPKQTRRRRQPLGDYLKSLGTEAVDEIYRDLDEQRNAILEWADPRARQELGISDGDWPEGELDNALTLKVVEIALHTLRKRSYAEFGEVAEAYLDGFEWPPEKDAPSGPQPVTEAPLRYRHSPGFLYPGSGHEDACLANIHCGIDRMSAVEIAESMRLFDAHRPEILAQCRAAAAETSPMRSGEVLDRQALHAAAEYWRNQPKVKWPKFVVPLELHPTPQAAAA